MKAQCWQRSQTRCSYAIFGYKLLFLQCTASLSHFRDTHVRLNLIPSIDTHLVKQVVTWYPAWTSFQPLPLSYLNKYSNLLWFPKPNISFCHDSQVWALENHMTEVVLLKWSLDIYIVLEVKSCTLHNAYCAQMYITQTEYLKCSNPSKCHLCNVLL